MPIAMRTSSPRSCDVRCGSTGAAGIGVPWPSGRCGGRQRIEVLAGLPAVARARRARGATAGADRALHEQRIEIADVAAFARLGIRRAVFGGELRLLIVVEIDQPAVQIVAVEQDLV